MKREKMEYKLRKELDKQRFVHTLGVEETAREMARIFGEDEEKAALAGLLLYDLQPVSISIPDNVA